MTKKWNMKHNSKKKKWSILLNKKKPTKIKFKMKKNWSLIWWKKFMISIKKITDPFVMNLIINIYSVVIIDLNKFLIINKELSKNHSWWSHALKLWFIYFNTSITLLFISSFTNQAFFIKPIITIFKWTSSIWSQFVVLTAFCAAVSFILRATFDLARSTF